MTEVAPGNAQPPTEISFAQQVAAQIRAEGLTIAKLDEIGDFWTRRGLTGGLATIGTVAAGVGIYLRYETDHWNDLDLFACLAFAVLVFALALVAGLAASRVLTSKRNDVFRSMRSNPTRKSPSIVTPQRGRPMQRTPQEARLEKAVGNPVRTR